MQTLAQQDLISRSGKGGSGGGGRKEQGQAKNHSQKAKYLGNFFFLFDSQSNAVFSPEPELFLTTNIGTDRFCSLWFTLVTSVTSFYFSNVKYPFPHFCFMERFFSLSLLHVSALAELHVNQGRWSGFIQQNVDIFILFSGYLWR